MPRFRLLAPALFVLSAACGPAEEAPPSFATDQPRFIQGLNLLSDDTRTAFPDFERRWDRIAQDTTDRLARSSSSSMRARRTSTSSR